MTRDRLEKAKPPGNRAGLERWISQRAKADGVVVDRVRRGVSFMVVSAVLARITSSTGTPLFVLKGGVGMQLRLGSRARTSRDYDAVFREDLAKLETILEQAPEHPIGQFVVTASPVEPIGPTGAVRSDLTIRYGTTPWGKIMLEVSRPEGGVDGRRCPRLPRTRPQPLGLRVPALGQYPLLVSAVSDRPEDPRLHGGPGA